MAGNIAKCLKARLQAVQEAGIEVLCASLVQKYDMHDPGFRLPSCDETAVLMKCVFGKLYFAFPVWAVKKGMVHVYRRNHA